MRAVAMKKARGFGLEIKVALLVYIFPYCLVHVRTGVEHECNTPRSSVGHDRTTRGTLVAGQKMKHGASGYRPYLLAEDYVVCGAHHGMGPGCARGF